MNIFVKLKKGNQIAHEERADNTHSLSHTQLG